MTATEHADESPVLESEILRAIASVDDPEYPGLSIVDLGLFESFDADANGAIAVRLLPTFSGCPALTLIASDVEEAVSSVDGVSDVVVSWQRSPAWAPDRMSPKAVQTLASTFTVAVQIGTQAPTCPLCGSATDQVSMFGPSRCRSIHRCKTCAEAVEVMRT